MILTPASCECHRRGGGDGTLCRLACHWPGTDVRYILDKYADNPGFYPGDMFLCNDPYSGALHQNDVTLVAAGV